MTCLPHLVFDLQLTSWDHGGTNDQTGGASCSLVICLEALLVLGQASPPPTQSSKARRLRSLRSFATLPASVLAYRAAAWVQAPGWPPGSRQNGTACRKIQRGTAPLTCKVFVCACVMGAGQEALCVTGESGQGECGCSERGSLFCAICLLRDLNPCKVLLSQQAKFVVEGPFHGQFRGVLLPACALHMCCLHAR